MTALLGLLVLVGIAAGVIWLVGYFANSSSTREAGQKMQGVGGGCLKAGCGVIAAIFILITLSIMCSQH
jgi:hypothetical protein